MCGSGATSVFFSQVAKREQMNALTSYIDASMVYGNSEVEARNLRDFASSHGLLRTSPPRLPTQKAFMPPNQGEFIDCQMDANTAHVPCFQAGDHRANEQPGLLTMHTLWVREHNRIATELLAINPHWDSDTVYHETRKIVGALVQHITYQHWLPKILGNTGMNLIGPYKGYDPNVDTRVSTEFATAAFRFGHTLIQPIIARLNETFQPIPEGNLPLHQAFFAPFRLVEEGGVDPIIRGLIGLAAKRVKPGEFLNSELTERLFTLAHEVALDLAAFNLQRGRDHGLQPYNEYRKYCGLRYATTFDDFRTEIRNDDVIRKLQNIYGHPDNVELFVGGIAEEPVSGARLGPTFMCIIADQFRRIRDGDRFWYENPDVFTSSQLVELRQASLGRIICDNADSINQIPQDVFLFLPSLPNGQVSCDVIPKVDLQVWAKCCQDCARSGDFRSITHHLRARRSLTDQTLADERTLSESAGSQSLNGSTLHPQGSGTSPKVLNTSHPRGGSEVEPGVLGEMMHMSQKLMDAVDVRIEGMEEMMNKLLETVDKLNRKIRKLEKSMPHHDTKNPVDHLKQTNCLDDKGQVKIHGSKWTERDCRTCQCKNGELLCTVEVCPLPTCKNPVKVQGQCCPVCPA
jgi:peroxidase